MGALIITDDDLREHREARGHSLFAPSSAHRWMHCPGSVAATMDLPDNAGVAAAQGTLCHTICEYILTGRDVSHYAVGTTHKVDGFDIELDEGLWALIDWAIERAESYNDAVTTRYEMRVNLEGVLGAKHQKGTADIVAVYPTHLIVADFKFGYLDVSPERNEQEMLYCAGVVAEMDLWHLDRFCVAIIQPRSSSFKEYWFDRTELLAFVTDAQEAVRRARLQGAERVPDPDTCEWCLVRGSCKARAKQIGEFMMEASDQKFDPQALTTEQLGRVLAWRKAIEGFLKDAFDELTKRVVQGDEEPPEGWVEGLGRQGNRVYHAVAQDDLIEFWGLDLDEVTKRVMLTPPTLEGLVRKKLGLTKAGAAKLVSGLTTRHPARRVLKRDGAEVDDFGDVFDFDPPVDDY